MHRQFVTFWAGLNPDRSILECAEPNENMRFYARGLQQGRVEGLELVNQYVNRMVTPPTYFIDRDCKKCGGEITIEETQI